LGLQREATGEREGKDGEAEVAEEGTALHGRLLRVEMR
jgi:hypothetical protein